MTQITDQAVGDILAAARPAVEAVEDHYLTEVAAANARADNAEHDRDQARQELADHLATHLADPEPVPVTAGPVIGMNTITGWDAAVAGLGAEGARLGARRIFCDLTSTGRDQEALIREAIADGHLPVLSYKVPNVATMASGGYDTWVAALRTFLASLGVPVAVTYWHEPRTDMTTAQFIAGSKRFLAVKSELVKVGPILNGWLLQSRVAEFSSWTDAELRQGADFIGADCYEDGAILPANLIAKLAAWRDANMPGAPIVVGEFNGSSAAVIKATGEALLSTPNVWLGNVWNNTGSGSAQATPLSGDRLTAFRSILADPRAK